MLVGRDGELAAMERLLSMRDAHEDRTVLVHGAMGIGKTTLLRSCGERARRAGFTVATAYADRLEVDFAFGVVRQLFDPLLRRLADEERDALLSGPAGLARPVFGLSGLTGGEPVGEPAQLFSRLHGLYWLAADLAAARPLYLAVDDLQWIDAPSARWLAYLLRRVEGVPIVVVATLHSGELPPDSVTAVELPPRFRRRVTLGGLDEHSVAAVVGQVLGEPADARFCHACGMATGGNPFLLHALLRSVRASGAKPDAAAAARIREFGPPEVAKLVHATLVSLGRNAVALAEALAVLGDAAELDLLAATAGLPQLTAVDLAQVLSGTGLLSVDDDRVGFTHAIVRTALVNSLVPSVRHNLHARAARLLADRGALERAAAQLLAAGPLGEPWALDVLRAAATDATDLGAPEIAATYLGRALHEPMPATVRSALLVDLGRAQLGTDSAVERLREGLALCENPYERIRVASDLARALALADRFPEAIEVLRRTADAVRDADRHLALRLDIEQIFLSTLLLSTSPSVQEPLAELDFSQGAGSFAELALAGLLSYRTYVAGQSAAEANRLARHALVRGFLPEDDESFAYYGAMYALMASGDLDLALDHCNNAVDIAQRRGSLFSYAVACTVRAEANFRLGRVLDCETDAQASLSIRKELGIGRQHGFAWVLGWLLGALVERDRLDEAEDMFASLELLGEMPASILYSPLLMARGRLRLAQGRFEDAATDLLECGRRMELCSMPNPAILPWRSEAATALAALREHDAARKLAEEELTLARQWGTAQAVGVAQRACGVVSTGREAINLLRQAVDTLADSPARLDHAQALTDLGAALRRHHYLGEARERLRDAIDLARRCGAARLGKRADQELRATGARPRRRAYSGVEALTPAERRVATLAASGLPNRNIAQQLFVGQRTVEVHLTNAYRKLGVQGRPDLVHILETAGG